MDINLSIIVPVYNVEDYILECVESLLQIPIKGKEIIIINDGSTDQSIDKIKKFKTNELRIINQENSGLSAARNTGLEYANGKYILFIDSDDFIINPNRVAEMCDIAQKEDLDIVIGNGYTYYSDNKKYPIYKNSGSLNNFVIDGKGFLKESLEKRNFKAMVWLNLYKHEFIKENKFEFLKGFYHEDIDWTIKVMLKAKKVLYKETIFYIYRQREGSIMRAKDYTKHSNDMIKICLNNIHIIDNEKDEQLKSLLYDEMLDTIFWAIMRAQKSNSNFIKQKYLDDIPYEKAGNFKTKVKYWIFKKSKYIAYLVNEIYEKLKSNN